LLAHGAKADIANDRREMPVHLACSLGQTAVLQKLIELDVRLSFQDKAMRTPLMRAISSGQDNLAEVVDLLLGQKIEVNQVDSSGRLSQFWLDFESCIRSTQRDQEVVCDVFVICDVFVVCDVIVFATSLWLATSLWFATSLWLATSLWHATSLWFATSLWVVTSL
jgi:hypothetical protein